MAVLDLCIAAYLALYRVLPGVWEPFFGDGSRQVLDSWLSHILPVSDATLGALAYLADVITGSVGGQDRWRRMPWIVVVFAVLVGPLGLVSVGLVIAQPVMFNAWCTLCIATAVLSVAMIGPAMDEALACFQYLKKVRQRNDGTFWKVFWGRS